jgi:hypothetical protein
MRSRAVLVLLLVSNLVLAVGWFWTARIQARRLVLAGIVPEGEVAPLVRTNVLVRKQFFSWQEVESDDYPTYIAHLRDIGCPEQTIRDIIIADVNALYARKRATEIVTAEQQWWRSEPDTAVVNAAAARTRELDQERRALLARLLGPGWEGGDLVSLPRPTRPGVVLDGPVLGLLPNDVKQSVEEISLRSQDRIAAYLEERRKAGQPVDPIELARLRQQTRAELAQVLSPFQLEEFLLRYSQNAGTLRSELGQLKYFDASADEFRAVFRATDAIDQQLDLLAGATDPNSVAQRRSLEEQRALALKNALGAGRFAQFQMLQNPGFRDAYAAALEAGTPDAAPTLYEINRASQEEMARLRGQTNLTPEQLAIKLKQVELEQLTGTAQALGQELPAAPPSPPKPAPSKVHVLAAGENLDFLARLYGVDPVALRAANPNLNFNRPKAGDSVSIPISLLPGVPLPSPP